MLPYQRILPVTFLLASLLLCEAASAQIPRQRANPGGPVEELFWAPTIIGMESVTNMPKGNFNFTIMHSFGILTNGIEDLFGLDGAANIRFGIDYGVTDRLSVGFGRSRFDKLYDFRVKAKVLRQTRDNRIPVEVAVKGDLGITTLENGFDLVDRLSFLTSVMIARKVSDRISLQVMPMFSHFNTVFNPGINENNHIAIGVGGRWVVSDRIALTAEYLPVIGDRSDETVNVFSVGFDIETGGHVFQLFFTPTQWMTEQHIIARNTDNFFDGDFRFGFNVNRVFALGG